MSEIPTPLSNRAQFHRDNGHALAWIDGNSPAHPPTVGCGEVANHTDQ